MPGTIVLAAIQTAAGANEPNNLFVVLMGLGTVFAGLFGIVIICSIMGMILRRDKNAPAQPAPLTENAAPAGGTDIPNRGEFIAAVSAAIAEDMGTDVGAIRILSVKKL